MPPKAQRSRACNQCRDRRVKCDETPGHCNQCKRLGLPCSGPIQGSVIIDMTDRVTKPRQRKKREKPVVATKDDIEKDKHVIVPKVEHPPTPITPISPVTSLSESAAPSVQDLEVFRTPETTPDSSVVTSLSIDRRVGTQTALNIIRSQYRLPTLYQPSLAEEFDKVFTSHFVELNKGVRATNPETQWLTAMPGLSTAADSRALKLSVRAASMAFYARVHSNAPVLVDSYRWYTVSLNSQRMALSRLHGEQLPNSEECLVPIILGLYEVYAGTTPTSVFHHLRAAISILGMRGPMHCATGPTAVMFRAVRVSDAHKAIVFNRPSVFAAPDWMTLPFATVRRQSHQRLADILLMIPVCIGLCDNQSNLIGFFSKPIPSTVDLRPVRYRAKELLRSLLEWAERYPESIVPTSISAPAIPGMPNTALYRSVSGGTIQVPDTYIALTAATYKAAHMILTLLIDKVSPKTLIASILSPDPSTTTGSSVVDSVTKHAYEILEISTLVESTHPVGFDFLRSVFPLIIVAVLSPLAEQRRASQEMLDRWGERRGLSGLCGAWINHDGD